MNNNRNRKNKYKKHTFFITVIFEMEASDIFYGFDRKRVYPSSKLCINTYNCNANSDKNKLKKDGFNQMKKTTKKLLSRIQILTIGFEVSKRDVGVSTDTSFQSIPR